MSTRKEQLSDHTLKTATWKGVNDEFECPEGNWRHGQTERFNAKDNKMPRLWRGHYTVCVTRRESEWATEGRTGAGTRQLLTQGRILKRNQTYVEGKWAEELQDCIPLRGIKKSMLLILPECFPIVKLNRF